MKALLLAILSACSQPASAPSAFAVRTTTTGPHSVCIIILDDVGWSERATMAGSLDALAAAGVTFNRFCAEPLCSPARYACYYGRYPRRAGIGNIVAPVYPGETPESLPNEWREVSIFETLKPTHRTALVGKWHLGRAGTETGSDLLAVTESGPFVAGVEDWLAGAPSSDGVGGTGHFSWYRVDNATITNPETTYSAAAQRDAFINWWTNTSGAKLGVLACNVPHEPFDKPPGYSTAFGTRNKYLQGCTYMNGVVNAVMAAIDLSDTFVVVFGDNGTPDAARIVGSPTGVWKTSCAGNGTTFGGGVVTPLIVAGPGISAGVTSTRLVSVVDIPATLFELLGVSSRGFEDSVSFADALGSWTGATPRNFTFAERYGAAASNKDDYCIIRQAWKMRVVDADGTGAGAPVTSYYDLTNDVYEQTPTTPPSGVLSDFAADLASLPARK